MGALSYPLHDAVDARAQIAFIEQALHLSDAELGALFRVSRQAIALWRKKGVPPERAAGVDRLVELTQTLQRRLIPARIPTIVRTAAKGLDGKSMLATIASDGIDAVYLYLARLADYAGA